MRFEPLRGRVRFESKIKIKQTIMEISRHHKHRLVHFIVKTALQAGTLVAAIAAVHQLERIHHTLRKIEHKDKKHLL